MKILILCYLSFILLADIAQSTSDNEDLVDELLDAVQDKESDTDASPVDEDKREEEDLDLKIIQDILSGDKQRLQDDLQERQIDIGYQDFLEKIGLGIADILKDATQDVGGYIVKLVKKATSELEDNRRDRYLCRLSKRKRPKWLGSLKDVFEDVDQFLDEQAHCQNE